MKQTYTKVLTFIACLLCGMSATAADFVVDGISYDKYSSTEVAVTTGDSYSGDIIIPETITIDDVTYKVVRINSNAFSGFSGVTSITLPNTINYIGGYAFKQTSITTISIPESVIQIGWNAFEKCTSLETVTLPEGLTYLPDQAFDGCSVLTTINLPSSLTKINMRCFRNCYKLANIEIPSSVNTIGQQAFQNCSKLPNKISINAETVGSGAFSGCKIYYLTLGENVKTLNDAFSNCTIYEFTFNTPTPPSTSTYKYCDATTIIRLNGEWVEAYKQADVWKDFYYVVATWDKTKSTLIDGIYYNFTSENTAEVVAGENAYTGAITIPATVEYEGNTYNVTAIRSEAFCKSAITSVSLPEGIEKIGVGAFYACNSLKSIAFPNSLTTLDACAFGTSAIEKITWGTGLTALNGMTFWKTRNSFTPELTIPASITSLGYGDFGGWFGYDGGSLTMESATPPTVDAGVFDSPFSFFDGEYAVLNVPAGSLEAYKSTEPWKYFGTINEKKVVSETLFEYKGLWYEVIEGSENEVQLVADAYSGYSVVVPATAKNGDKIYTVTRIAENAFAGTNAKNITLPPTITTIGENAFNVTNSIMFYLYCNATIPPTLESTSTFAFDTWRYKYLFVPAGSEEAYAATDQWKEFTVKTDNTGVESIEANGNNIVVNGNEINVEGDANIAVYSINGQLIYAGKNITVSVPAGVYIVKVNNTTHKVIIK